MVSEPKNRISERALTVWRISGSIQTLFMLLFSGGMIGLTVKFEWPNWIIWIAILLLIAYAYLIIYLFPSLKWKRWRYEVREQEIELQRGIFIITRTLVPMVRVQHVDTQQGPLLRKYKLATVTVSTAATIHEIPALELEEAEEIRLFISRLARVADEDV
ncbi:PH domain-containing protein [Bacillus sp. 31A1R]|uniref:PH domain-containing protein n=1 Tax=Robertmurraya mangrovi TaxID=3098077 RepID=A0ABU5J5C6_9BACI|nr:PH domain-containing protein [Bacillus sp. 31A1R]MDZ5474587.1 PH domain-containing protein [Bacillus sp. 31A1R]